MSTLVIFRDLPAEVRSFTTSPRIPFSPPGDRNVMVVDSRGRKSIASRCLRVRFSLPAPILVALVIYSPSMAEISMVVTSIDPLAPYKVSDDLVLELVNVTATISDDPEDAAAGMSWVKVVEPQELVKHQPTGGYMVDNRHLQMTCAKSAGVRLGDRIKFRIVS